MAHSVVHYRPAEHDSGLGYFTAGVNVFSFCMEAAAFRRYSRI